jgi:hypothetical protein
MRSRTPFTEHPSSALPQQGSTTMRPRRQSKLSGTKTALIGGGVALLSLLGGVAAIPHPAAAAELPAVCYPLGDQWVSHIRARDMSLYFGDPNNASINARAANLVLRQLKANGCAPEDWPPEREVYYYD